MKGLWCPNEECNRKLYYCKKGLLCLTSLVFKLPDLQQKLNFSMLDVRRLRYTRKLNSLGD